MAMNEIPALESRLLRTQPFTVTAVPTLVVPDRRDDMVDFVMVPAPQLPMY